MTEHVHVVHPDLPRLEHVVSPEMARVLAKSGWRRKAAKSRKPRHEPATTTETEE
ncbi:MAG: hypothetical protein ACRDP4_13735 [Nocardioidaceae bacterium]